MTHRNNPQKGANMVDRYIGSAFDIVYAVYKHLPNMPVFLEFVNEISPRMEAQYADIIGRFDHIVLLEASALDSKEVAEQAAEDAMEYRDTTQQLIDEAEEFKQFVINVVENTIQDIEDRFAEFIVASGYEFIGNYGIGIEVTEYNQLLRDVDGEFWRLSGQRSIPYITTGAGLPEDDAFIPVGDASLRQDLDDPVHGSKIVQYDENNTVYDAINRNREDFWANKETMGGIYTHHVREDDGTPVAGAECAVYVGKSGVLATGLKDKFGEPLANPFVSAADGLVQFVADPGMYTLQVSFDLVVHTYSVYFADEQVRADLANPGKGAAMVARGVMAVDSIADLLALPEGQRKEGLRYLVKGYHAGSSVGGGLFEYTPTSSFPDDGGRRIGNFVRVTLPNDTPFTFAKYGYDFVNHSISGQVIAQKIFDTALTIPDSEHLVIEISDGVIFTTGTATLNRANLTMRCNGTAYVSGDSGGNRRFIEILLPEERNKNLVLENLKFIGLFDGTLLEMYQNRNSEYGSRFYVSGADGVRVRGVTAKRISIPMDIRNSNDVQVNNISLIEGNCGLSVINCTSVNISNITGIDCTGSAIDFSGVRGGVVSNITGFTSEDGRGYAEEFFDMGSCQDLAISNLQSIGPTGNMIRIKFEDINLPFSNIRISNVVGRGSRIGVVIQPSTNDTGTLTEHIHIDGITVDSAETCILMTGTTRVYNVSVTNFNLISRGAVGISLPGVSDINISNGSVFCAAPNNTSEAILLGKRAVAGGIAGDRIRLSNVSVGSSNLGREAVNINEANGVFMSDVTVTQSERDGITFKNCRDVNLSNMDVNKTSRSGITASFSAAAFTNGEDVGFRIKSSNFTDFGYKTANRAAIVLVSDGISISGVEITGNHARVTPLAPEHVRFHALFDSKNGGSFGLGSIFARNTTKGIPRMTGGNAGSVLVKDNDAIDIAPAEPEA